MLCSPDGMMRSVQACPSASMLADLKDCLDFCSNSWVSLFCRQGGTALLLQVCCSATSSDEAFLRIFTVAPLGLRIWSCQGWSMKRGKSPPPEVPQRCLYHAACD